MKRIILSKKVVVSLVGLVISVLVAAGIPMPPGLEETLINAITALVVSFNVGQGIADAFSRGRTSAGRDMYD